MKTKYICIPILLILVTGIAAAIPGNNPGKEGKTLDEKFLDVATDVPGFGGMFIEGGVSNVYLSDPSQKPAAKAAIAKTFGIEHAKNIQILQGKYSFSQLKEWNNIAGALFDTNNIVYTDVDEKTKQIEDRCGQFRF